MHAVRDTDTIAFTGADFFFAHLHHSNEKSTCTWYKWKNFLRITGVGMPEC